MFGHARRNRDLWHAVAAAVVRPWGIATAFGARTLLSALAAERRRERAGQNSSP